MKTVTTLLLVAIALAVPMVAEADALDEGRVKELVYEAIRENPDIVMEALSTLQKRQAAAEATNASDFLAAERDVIERDPNAPVLGNPEGDVTVVEFFDYNCPYCRRAAPEVDALIAKDRNIRLVYREWPILGEGSVFAARAALASRKQGKYPEFHAAMMRLQGRAEEKSVLRVAAELGLDMDRLRQDMTAPEIEEHIATSMRLTRGLGFQGTPSFVIGDGLIPGFVDRSQLEEYVAKARD
ncbi:MAG: DsbA family protein [Rhodobacteraceae bacterium]|nr:DsbA family protein [Paracoccaceae bacterium]MCB2105394.1 DsbA family protein [Paracoccaceae bacterium]